MKKIITAIFLLISEISLGNTIEIKAIVNENIITNYDIDQRKKLSKALLERNNIKMSEEEIEKNVKREMIEDKIKIDEAKKYNIYITKDELEEAKKNMEQRLNLGENGYENILKENNIEERVLNEQIEGDLIWMKFTMQVLRGYIKVQDREVEESLKKQMGEIYEYTLIPYIVKNNRIKEAMKKIEGVNSCEDFEKIAKEEGGEGSGYRLEILENQMQEDLYKAVKEGKDKNILDPIRLNGNYTIFYVCDKKRNIEEIDEKKKEEMRYMIYMGKLEAYANKYFEKIKANAVIEEK